MVCQALGKYENLLDELTVLSSKGKDKGLESHKGPTIQMCDGEVHKTHKIQALSVLVTGEKWELLKDKM